MGWTPLDALRLATALYLTAHRAPIILATYDRRMAEVALPVGLRVVEPG